MLQITNLSLRRQHKHLFDDANFSLSAKQRVGLIGNNGCGKSSLFACINGELDADSGEISRQKNISINHLAQEIPNSDENCLDYVIAGNHEYSRLTKQLESALAQNDDKLIHITQEKLHQIDSYRVPAKAAQILNGLGFSEEKTHRAVNDFSGGWRMRISLARCLMSNADILLLDEPTNHLDLETIYWLEKWLQQSPASLLIISHDRDFLDAVTTDIIHIDNKQFTSYHGNYSQFEQTRALKLSHQQAQYEKQQKQIEHMMSFVNRFKAKATKAKQAQSRLKAIEKMDIIAKAHIDSPFSFNFFPCEKSADPLIQLEHCELGYDVSSPILSKVNLCLRKKDRIGLLGLNGAGKSTLIKSLTGELAPLAGEIIQAPHNLHIGYYAQYQLSQVDGDASVVDHIQRLSPKASEQSIRQFVGGFGFCGDMATNRVEKFSGGEKARLVLAMLVWKKPNVLLLDEPTNHLDMNMRSAIEIALQSFEGALVLISHDRHLLNTCVDDYYLVANGKVSQYDGTLDSYQKLAATELTAGSSDCDTKVKNSSHKQKKAQQNRIKTLEKKINELQGKINQLDEELAQSELYSASQSDKLANVIKEKERLSEQLNKTEQQWLDLAD